MEVPEFNIEQDDAFAVRMQFGTFLGDVKNWAVTLGQIPHHLSELLNDWDNVEDKDDPVVFKNTLAQINEFVAHGLTALINLIQQQATQLYGEPFGNNDFQYEGQSLSIRSADEVQIQIKDVPKEIIEELISSDGMPDFLKDIFREMMDNNNQEEGEDNE